MEEEEEEEEEEERERQRVNLQNRYPSVRLYANSFYP